MAVFVALLLVIAVVTPALAESDLEIGQTWSHAGDARAEESGSEATVPSDPEVTLMAASNYRYRNYEYGYWPYYPYSYYPYYWYYPYSYYPYYGYYPYRYYPYSYYPYYSYYSRYPWYWYPYY
jgi:hypothetical protein